MKLLRKLFVVKKMIEDFKKTFSEPDTVIDQMLILLFMDKILSEDEIKIIDINILHRCGASEIIKLSKEDIKKEIERLDEINVKKYEELGVHQNGN